ncbi:MAG: hypothetical protein LUC49_04800 [Prevotella sp.]|nr:hypothetical protein [Prevotella sp.]
MSATLTGKIGVTFSSNYAQLELTDIIPTSGALDVSEYTGCRIVCSEVNNVQLKVEYEDMTDISNTGNEYVSLSTGTNNLTFLTGHGKVTMLALQDNGSGGTTPSSCVIEEAYLIKAAEEGGEATEEPMAYYTVDSTYSYTYGGSYVAYSPKITYNQQYGENYIVNADGTPFTFTSSDEDTYSFTITLAEAADIDLMLESRYIDENNEEQHLSYDFPSISAGSTSCTFTVDASSVTDHDIAYIKIKSNTADVDGEDSHYPAVVKFASIVATVTGDDIRGDFDTSFTLPKNVCTSDHTIGGANFTTDSSTSNTYVADDRTITFGSSYAGYGWWLGGYNDESNDNARTNVEDYSGYQGIEVAFKTTATSDELIQLVVEYFRDEDCTEGDIVTSAAYTLGTGDGENFGTGQTLYIDFSQTYASHMYQIYIQNGNSSGTKIQLLGARLIPKSNDDEEYSYKMNLAGYATSNWNSGSDVITINELDGDDFLGTADLTFTSGYSDATIGLGWHDWGNTGDGAFNLAQFDEVRITYKVTPADDASTNDDEVEGETENKITVQALFNNTNYGDEEGTNVNIVQKDSNEDGIITLTIAAGSFTDDSGTEVDEFDWTHVGQFVIQASAACTVKITSIEFYRGVRTAPAVQTIDVSTSSDNIIISRTGGTIYVKGDGSSTGYTFSFPLNATGTYDIYIADGTKIDTSKGESNLNAGITIPRGVTVNLYFDGESSVSGSTYGIYANYGSTLHIYTYAEQSSSSGQATETTSKTTDLTINGDYGIWFYGSSLKIDGVTEEWKTNYNIYSYTTQNRGQITINSKYCGIYFGPETTGTVIEGCNVSIYISGSADDLENATDNYVDGVSGIYNDCASGSQINFQAMDLTIWAPEDGTYGCFSNVTNGNGIWFGAGTYVIKATKCVLHHPDGTQYSGGFSYLQNGGDDSPVTLQLIGPFCIHREPQTWGGYNIWSCDGSTFSYTGNGDDDDDLTVNGGYTILPSGVTYQADDQYDYDSAYTTVYSVTEMEYYNRNLYKGWNTLSLPCDYDLSATSTEEDASYEGVEARKVISKVATFTSLMSAEDYEAQNGSTTDGDTNNAKRLTTVNDLDDEENVDDGDDSTEDTPDYTFYLTFTYVDTDANPTLTAGTPYLVYVEDPTAGSTSQTSAEDGEEGNATSYADEWKVLAHFTSMSKNLNHMYDDKGDGLKTVYHAETLKADGEISGDSNEEDTYYYKFFNPASRGEDGEAYFNRPREGKTAKVGGFRAYLDASELGNTSAQSLSIIFDDGTTTSIEELDGGVNAENSRVRVYSVDGKLIKVAGAGEATKGLARGVYVVDGKKVVVM